MFSGHENVAQLLQPDGRACAGVVGDGHGRLSRHRCVCRYRDGGDGLKLIAVTGGGGGGGGC